jgi:hypothetical protein
MLPYLLPFPTPLFPLPFTSMGPRTHGFAPTNIRFCFVIKTQRGLGQSGRSEKQITHLQITYMEFCHGLMHGARTQSQFYLDVTFKQPTGPSQSTQGIKRSECEADHDHLHPVSILRLRGTILPLHHTSSLSNFKQIFIKCFVDNASIQCNE